jgi:RNA polymerase-binding transcription factor DksA
MGWAKAKLRSKASIDYHRELGIVGLAGALETDMTGDVMDRQQSLSEAGLAVGRCEIGTTMSKAIHAALQAVEEGWYGTCSECGEKISTKRIQAAFWATTCTTCQEKKEKHEV